jgi:hypothetical protein
VLTLAIRVVSFLIPVSNMIPCSSLSLAEVVRALRKTKGDIL